MPTGTQRIRESLDMGPLRTRIQFTAVQHDTMSSQTCPSSHPYLTIKMGTADRKRNGMEKLSHPDRKPSLS
ncbi:hypothetical protein AA16373_1324 [Komagataeibacter swingsii DSM 16373]|nr:hypothetical protein AA16373_1324 [Komagataeibacter swingsii DSM 16373]